MTTRLGIIGVGKLGSALGRLALDAGYDLQVADDPARELLDLIVGSVLPGARLVDVDTLIATSDVIVLAVPQPVVETLPLGAVDGAIVVDATNAWEATDGVRALTAPTTLALAARHPHLRLVKTLNHLAYADLLADARPAGTPDRRALAVAGDDADAVATVVRLVDDLGFDPVPVGLALVGRLEPAGPVFGRRLTGADLEAALAP